MDTMTKEVALAIVANDNGRKELPLPRITTPEKRLERFNGIIEHLEVGKVSKFDVKSASSLADIRIRDGVLRKMYELHVAEDTETLTRYRETLADWASKANGTARLAILAIWAGSYWLEDNKEPVTAVLETEDFGEYSLWQLLDIAIRHNVPSHVWGASLADNPIDKCLQGAV
jgi:hypothetical protein